MNNGNGNGNGNGENADERKRVVVEAVTQAARISAQADIQEFASDIVAPLMLGPQRYTDPAAWGPPEDSRPLVGGDGPDSADKQPLTRDPRYEKLGGIVDKLDSSLRWPD